MAITEPFVFTATIGATETSMTTNTAGPDVDTSKGIFQAFIDLNAMALGDTFEFRVYETVVTTQRCALVQTFSHDQGTDSKIWISPSLIMYTGWDMTLKKTAGTDRSLVWSIRKVA